MQISPECLERRRLIRKVEEAVAAVYEFKDQLRNGWKNVTAVSILLDQARTAERHAQRALHDHIEEHGRGFFDLASRQGLEGIVGKDTQSPYVSGRETWHWLKIKDRQFERKEPVEFKAYRRLR